MLQRGFRQLQSRRTPGRFRLTARRLFPWAKAIAPLRRTSRPVAVAAPIPALPATTTTSAMIRSFCLRIATPRTVSRSLARLTKAITAVLCGWLTLLSLWSGLPGQLLSEREGAEPSESGSVGVDHEGAAGGRVVGDGEGDHPAVG